MNGDELSIIAWLRGQQREHKAVRLGIGDDMAIVSAGSAALLVSSDMLLDGVHFDTSCQALDRIGRKAICCCLSDCAAMAVRPVCATVSVALPKVMEPQSIKELLGGMLTVAEEYGLAIAGGDTTRWDHPLALDVAITAAPYEGIAPVRRSGALSSDELWVTGTLGGSSHGRHLDFAPRVEEARLLAEKLGDRLHAMIDLSDGLSLDLWRLCEASGVGAVLDERLLEAAASRDAKDLAGADGRTVIDHVLSDGEDFELLLAVEGDADVGNLEHVQSSSSRLTDSAHVQPSVNSRGLKPAAQQIKTKNALSLLRVGSVTDEGLHLCDADGELQPIQPRGFVH